MIDQKELNIGCWYNLKNPMSGDLIPMLFQTWADALDFEAYAEGIPVTPEWLEKLGFVKENNGWNINKPSSYTEPYFSLFDNNYCNGELDLQLNGSDMILPDVKYVHKLQILYYSLTEKELTIKSFNQSN